MRTFALTPADAWFFRDGRPYNVAPIKGPDQKSPVKEAPQADVPSVFPPPARTLSGALRAALARGNGWSGHGPWTPELNRAFGSGPNELGALQFTGPFLIKDGQSLWPLPRHLLGRTRERWEPIAFLHPDDKTHPTDNGDMNLPVLAAPGEKADGLKPAEAAWATTHALSTILQGTRPSAADIFMPRELWAHEARVALRRDETRLTTGEGALYSPAYVRLKRGVALGVGIAGVPDALKSDVPPLFPLGGESRLAQCEPWPHDPLPAAPPRDSFKHDDSGCIRFTVILLTPGCFKSPDLPGARVVSACVGKPQFIGGWDSLKREPLPLQPFAAAGSVWFCTAREDEFPSILALHGKHIGPYAAHGFGHIILGHWPTAHIQ